MCHNNLWSYLLLLLRIFCVALGYSLVSLASKCSPSSGNACANALGYSLIPTMGPSSRSGMAWYTTNTIIHLALRPGVLQLTLCAADGSHTECAVDPRLDAGRNGGGGRSEFFIIHFGHTGQIVIARRYAMPGIWISFFFSVGEAYCDCVREYIANWMVPGALEIWSVSECYMFLANEEWMRGYTLSKRRYCKCQCFKDYGFWWP